MGVKSEVDYDSKEDSIYIYKEGRKTKCSLDFEFGVVDIDHDNKVVGVEIFDASDFLERKKF